MTAEVIEVTGISKLDLPPERILARAAEAGLTEVVIIGFTEDGGEWFASSLASGPEVLWHLERAKFRLLQTVDEQADRLVFPPSLVYLQSSFRV